MIENTNDGNGQPPRLALFMNELALKDMAAPPGDILDAIHAAGYEGFQALGDRLEPDRQQACRKAGLRVCGSGRVNAVRDADEVAARMSDSGFLCGTLHVGWGMEDDRVARGLIEAVFAASLKYRLPLYVETHRATVFQDIWRTVQFTQSHPGIRFNGDFSHWYTGQEFVYGGFENKVQFIAPVLQRVRFLHGRIGNPGCMQVDIADGEAAGRPFVAHFRELWTASMRAFLQSGKPGDYLIFCPELLASDIYYAQNRESDRWRQSLVLCRIARECFAAASAPGA